MVKGFALIEVLICLLIYSFTALALIIVAIESGRVSRMISEHYDLNLQKQNQMENQSH